MELRPRRHQDHLRRVAGRFRQDVAAARDVAPGRRTIELRNVLAAEHQTDRPVLVLHGGPPRLRGLRGVPGPDHRKVRHRPQRHQLLDRLVRRAVLAEADRIVRPDEDRRELTQRRQANGRPHVVGEAEERGDEGPHPAVVRHAVGDRRHGVLAHAVVDVVAGSGLAVEVARALELRLRGLGEVRVAADEPRNVFCDGVQSLPARDACGHRLAHLPLGQIRVPSGRQRCLTGGPPFLRQIRIGRRPRREPTIPVARRFRSALEGGSEVLQSLRRLVEGLGPLPAERLLGERHFLHSERAAVRGRGPGLVRGPVSDRRPHGDDRGPLLLRDGGPDRRVDGIQIRVAVLDAQHLPAVRLVPAQDVFREGLRGWAVERDVVVVVEIRELAELQVPRERPRLRRDALHQVPVSHEGESPVVDDFVARPVVALGEEPLRDRHAHGVGRALAERPRRRLDAWRQVRLGVAGRPAAPLAEGLEVVESQVVARQMEQAVQQHAAVAGREHEPIPVGPVRVAGVVLEVALPEHVGHRRGSERKAWVPGVGFLDGVDRQRPDRVHAEFIERCMRRTQWALLIGPDLITPGRPQGRWKPASIRVR